MKRILSTERGFTLLEVLIAMVILAVGILATSKLQLSFMQSNAKARFITEGSAVAQARIEELMNLPYADAQLADIDGDGTGQPMNPDGSDQNGGNFGLDDATDATADHSLAVTPSANHEKTYNVLWNVAVDVPSANMKTVKLFVQWTDEKNVSRQVDYSFVKGNMF